MKNPSPSKSRKRRIRRTEDEWRAVVFGFADSEMSLEQYCQKHGVALSGFYSWRKRFKAKAFPSSEPSFVELLPPKPVYQGQSGPGQGHWRLELELGDGMRLRIR